MKWQNASVGHQVKNKNTPVHFFFASSSWCQDFFFFLSARKQGGYHLCFLVIDLRESFMRYSNVFQRRVDWF
uniref:Uncharacterized protein n=1 Tax=Apteryx owenii TaxID=8824 RepID=A0A8B9SBW6_APTOW